ncbi:MAG: hypothetical protein D3M94_05110 [Rhodocyclales bacterium GT-UBC]|nr:MAG: hypothetical protein D3M94_05110 [Rhodocyclales bacterium GT-UBC]
MTVDFRRSPAEVASALRLCLQGWQDDWPVADVATAEFCRQRVRMLADEKVLTAKMNADLGDRSWRPLGHVLAVISENDHLGVIAALVAAALTGNRLTLKSRSSQPALLALRDALGWNDDACRIADWDSLSQRDDELLTAVDAVLMAGSADLIRHYRQVAAPGVRLIEYGPQMSGAGIAEWPASAALQNACIDALIRDTCLFMQNVCSSPQFVLVPDDDTAKAVFAALVARLANLPSLPEEIRLRQLLKARELALLARLGEAVKLEVNAETGWGVSISAMDTANWLPRGFRLIVAGSAMLAPILQTFGIWPASDAVSAEFPDDVPVYHRCRLGRMHERPLTAPHDGQWELAQWVRFISCDTTP